MGWLIQCSKKSCGEKTWARNIVKLIDDHCDDNGWFICETCKSAGYIEKEFDLQEGGQWKPYLRGIVLLGDPGDTYQPFVFLVSGEPNSAPSDVWFSYYKDTRDQEGGGRLKLGYGPGGPPVMNAKTVVYLVGKLRGLGFHLPPCEP